MIVGRFYKGIIQQKARFAGWLLMRRKDIILTSHFNCILNCAKMPTSGPLPSKTLAFAPMSR